ncbi:MAG: hypothetical protein KF849_01640 [Rhizobiaceae bacterium]|nr:hypothetical protein [Rhizobiaceae bacterium]
MSVVRGGVAGRFEAEDRLAKSDRLFRAAISGFCSLTSPTRLDATRLDQLTLPLLPLVSDESRRYAAAALSHAFPGPQGLIRRIAEEDIAISAPVLVGSPVLSDIDLIGLIGRHGLAHAGAIGRRAKLNPNIASLIRALGVAGETVSAEPEMRAEMPAPQTVEPVAIAPVRSAPLMAVTAEAVRKARAVAMASQAASSQPQYANMQSTTALRDAGVEPVAAAFDDYVRAEPGAAEEAARDRLREMMRPAGARAPSRAHPNQAPVLPALDWDAVRRAATALVPTGLSGKAALFHTALADAFALAFAAAAAIAEAGDQRKLTTALKSADLPVAEAFLIAVLAFPPRFATTAAIRAFIETYAGIEVEKARHEVAGWQRRAPRRDAASTAWPEVANLAGESAAEVRQARLTA